MCRYLAQWHAKGARRGIHPHGCTGAGLALSFLSWVAGSHALPQSLLCWDIKDKTCMFSLISAGTNRLYLSDCKVLSGNRNFESAESWRKTPQIKPSQATQNTVRYLHLWVMVFHELLICVTKYYRAIVRHIQRSGLEESNFLIIKHLPEILILTA